MWWLRWEYQITSYSKLQGRINSGALTSNQSERLSLCSKGKKFCLAVNIFSATDAHSPPLTHGSEWENCPLGATPKPNPDLSGKRFSRSLVESYREENCREDSKSQVNSSVPAKFLSELALTWKVCLHLTTRIFFPDNLQSKFRRTRADDQEVRTTENPKYFCSCSTY